MKGSIEVQSLQSPSRAQVGATATKGEGRPWPRSSGPRHRPGCAEMRPARRCPLPGRHLRHCSPWDRLSSGKTEGCDVPLRGWGRLPLTGVPGAARGPASPLFRLGPGRLQASALPLAHPEVPLLASLPVSALLQGPQGSWPHPSIISADLRAPGLAPGSSGPPPAPGVSSHVFPHPSGPWGSHPDHRLGLAPLAAGS